MPVTTYSNQNTQTSGTAFNQTFGDKYAKTMVGQLFAAGGLNMKRAKAQQKYERAKAKLAAKGLTGSKYDKKMGMLERKFAGKLGPTAEEIALQNMTPVQYYPDPTVVPHDPYTVESIQQRAAKAMSGEDVSAAKQDLSTARQMAQLGPSYAARAAADASGVAPWQARTGAAMNESLGINREAADYLGNVLGGQYLNATNPHLQAAYQQAAGGLRDEYLMSVLPALEGRFANAGGSGGAQQAMYGRAMSELAGAQGDIATQMYYQNWADERDRMTRGATDLISAANAASTAGGLGTKAGELGLGAGALRLGAGDLGIQAGRLGIDTAGMAPTINQMGFYQQDELERAGRTREELARAQLQEQMDRFYFGQDQDFAALDRILNRGQQVPLAAGSGTTDYTQRTVGTGSQQAPSPPDQMPMWAQFVGSLI
jgi:hypothetical protein